MDRKAAGSKMLFGFSFILLVVQNGLALPAPSTDPAKEKSRLFKVITTLQQEANDLLDKYMQCHKSRWPKSLPGYAPSSSVSGENFSEKLQDIEAKGQICHGHVLNVERIQKDLLSEPMCISAASSKVKRTLVNLSHVARGLLQSNATATVHHPSLPPLDVYQKKVYGRAVLVRLKEWVEEVQLVLEKGT